MTCPKCQQKLEDILVSPNEECISFMCVNKDCKIYQQELYQCTGGILLTREEFMKRKREEGEG